MDLARSRVRGARHQSWPDGRAVAETYFSGGCARRLGNRSGTKMRPLSRPAEARHGYYYETTAREAAQRAYQYIRQGRRRCPVPATGNNCSGVWAERRIQIVAASAQTPLRSPFFRLDPKSAAPRNLPPHEILFILWRIARVLCPARGRPELNQLTSERKRPWNPVLQRAKTERRLRQFGKNKLRPGPGWKVRRG